LERASKASVWLLNEAEVGVTVRQAKVLDIQNLQIIFDTVLKPYRSF